MAVTFRNVMDAIGNRYSSETWWMMLPRERTAIIYREMREMDLHNVLENRRLTALAMKSDALGIQYSTTTEMAAMPGRPLMTIDSA